MNRIIADMSNMKINPIDESDSIRERLSKNIALFGRICFPKSLKREIPPFHTKIYDYLTDKRKKRVLIASPRGTSKSTIVSFLLPVFRVAYKRENEDLFIVIISESQTQSINFLTRIKNKVQDSNSFKSLFGDFGPNTAKAWSKTEVVFKNGARIVAVGTGNRVRGYITDDTRPNLIIVDDFESETNAGTPELRSDNRHWITEAVAPSLSDDGRLIMIGTVISEDCFLYWAKNSKIWNVLWFSIVDEEGQSIWPDKFPMSRINGIKEEFTSVGNPNGFYQEYMNKAQSPDSAPFKPEYIKTHDYTYEIIDTQPCLVKGEGNSREIKPVSVYAGIDPASSLRSTADFFVIAIIGIDYYDNKYIIDIFRGHLNPAFQPDKIISMYKKYKPDRMKIETVAYQEALRVSVRRLMFEEDIYIPGLETGIKPRNRKSERLLSMVPMLAKGKFYFRNEDLIAQKEFLSYPRGRNDDILDSIWIAIHKAYKCRYKNIDGLGENALQRGATKVLDWMTQ